MLVEKRNKRGYEDIKFDKITTRITALCKDLRNVNPVMVTLQTIKNMFNMMKTEEIDQISARVAESFILTHPEYSVLAARILVSNLHKMTPKTFSACMTELKNSTDLISDYHYNFIMKNAQVLDSMIIDSADYVLEYFGFKTLEANYFMKIAEQVYHSDGSPVYEYSMDNEKIQCNENAQITFNKQGKPILVNTNDNSYHALNIKTTNKIMDRPQYLFMREAIAVNLPLNLDLDNLINFSLSLGQIKQTYKLLSQQYYTHATPTLFNACCKNQQLGSCFLLGTGDSIEEIMKTVTNESFISKSAGGIGTHISNIRCENSLIKGTGGRSSGICKQLKLHNDVAVTWNQGGKRKGSIAIYLEPWHGDVMKFLRMKLNQGVDEERARDLFYALWVPDLFVLRAKAQQKWSLFSENTACGLSEVYDGMQVCSSCNYCYNRAYAKYAVSCDTSYVNGNLLVEMPINGTAMELVGNQIDCVHKFEPRNVFTELYHYYEQEGLAVGVLPAVNVLNAICDLQRESGTPYICFKDHVNRANAQESIGTIKSSNLCTEIMEWSSKDSYATCTLASINLKKFIVVSKDTNNKLEFDYAALHSVVQHITQRLDTVIDVNKYPVAECIANARDYRPIGIGIQGLANVFMELRIPFLSDEAQEIDLTIAETIYHAAITASCELARLKGKYVGFDNSPAARGILAFDFGNKVVKLSGLYDWTATKADIAKYGLRNSLLITNMPTVSTSQILGNNESFEPISATIYTKNTLSGVYTIVATDMIKHLIELGLWNDQLKNKIIANNGSVQLEDIPAEVRAIYATVYELKQTELMRRCALRQSFVDQAQSLNIHLNSNTNQTLKGVFFHGWELGLKTGSYYIRTKPAMTAMKNNISSLEVTSNSNNVISNTEPECLNCQS